MVKLIDICHDRREKRYFKAKCPFCDSILAFEYGDIWWSEPSEVIGQVPCPICRTKFFINGLDFPSFLVTAEPISEDEWEAARTDVSKRGIEELMMAKAANETDAASSVDPEEYRDFIAEKGGIIK